MADETKTVLEFIDKQTTAKLLTDLVNISSPTGEEAEIAKYLVDRFEKVGLKATLQEADEGRYNAVGLLEGNGSGLSLMFNGHMDTSFTGRHADPNPSTFAADGGIIENPAYVVSYAWFVRVNEGGCR